jgi:hypothetical protein
VLAAHPRNLLHPPPNLGDRVCGSSRALSPLHSAGWTVFCFEVRLSCLCDNGTIRYLFRRIARKYHHTASGGLLCPCSLNIHQSAVHVFFLRPPCRPPPPHQQLFQSPTGLPLLAMQYRGIVDSSSSIVSKSCAWMAYTRYMCAQRTSRESVGGGIYCITVQYHDFPEQSLSSGSDDMNPKSPE